MSYSFSYTENSTFTVTHARHMASKVATDLKRMQRFYGNPSDADVASYEVEVIALIRAGYLWAVTYGYKKDGKWIEPTLKYTARELTGATANDDDPGRIQPGADISGAVFHSYLTYSAAWELLGQAERDCFKATLPFFRNGAAEPGVSGYFSNDRTYSSGGRTLDRSAVKSFR
jgi:Bacterial HORMA domain family 1